MAKISLRWQFVLISVGTTYAAIVPRAGPSQAAWDSLNATLSGRLAIGVPFSRPCFSVVEPGVGGSFDTQQCDMLQAQYTNNTFRPDFFGSYQNTQFETCQTTSQQCLLDYTNTDNASAFSPPARCSQGSVANHYIPVRDENDVIAAFAFSKANGVRLIVKNTGHDYIGRSSGPDTLGLWTHNLRGIKYSKTFVEQGCSGSGLPAVTYAAGTVAGELYQFAENNNITVPLGSDAAVGVAGGYLQAGGHSAVSNHFGLAVDRVLQFKVVTPDGHLRYANRCMNTDLFFALRGGGGGTFGVVLEATIKASPAQNFVGVLATWEDTTANKQAIVEFMVNNALNHTNDGWGGYLLGLDRLVYVNAVLDEAGATASLASLKTFVTGTLGGDFTLKVEPTWLNWFNTFILPSQVAIGIPTVTSSRLIPAANFATAQSRSTLTSTLNTVFDGVAFPAIFIVSPNNYQGDTNGTSVTPAWRNSVWHVNTFDTWNFDTSASEKQAIYTKLTQSMNAVRQITPGSGAYQNEADVYEPNWSDSFWGSNYPQLLTIKNKYDPHHLLDCWHCVGWRGATDPQFQCYFNL